MLKVLSEDPKGRYKLEDLCLYKRMLLKWILHNQGTMSIKLLIWFITGIFGGFSLSTVI
jgi:hypothetical protein